MELAIQAGAENIAAGSNGEFVKYITPEMQEFAKLVVYDAIKECSKICESLCAGATADTPDGPDPVKYAEYKAACACRTAIKAHFGVL